MPWLSSTHTATELGIAVLTLGCWQPAAFYCGHVFLLLFVTDVAVVAAVDADVGGGVLLRLAETAKQSPRAKRVRLGTRSTKHEKRVLQGKRCAGRSAAGGLRNEGTECKGVARNSTEATEEPGQGKREGEVGTSGTLARYLGGLSD